MTDTMIRGPLWGGTGTSAPFTAGFSGAQRSMDAHGRFADALLGGRLFSGGMTATSIAASTFATGDLSATGKPIVGIWNPMSNDKNALVYQSALQVIITALQNTGPGTYVWATGAAQAAISTGSAPLNRKTLLATGSNIKDMSGIAMTGLVGTLTVRHASHMAGGSLFGSLSTLATAAGFNTQIVPSVENFDGGILVPPGGILGLFSTTQAVAHSAASAILWEEIPLFV